MAINIKLLAAFVTVILVMVFGYSGYSLFLDYQNTRQLVKRKTDDAVQKLARQFKEIEADNRSFALMVNGDAAVMNAFGSRDRTLCGNALKLAIDKTGFVGIVTIIDNNGNVFYSTDTPAKSGYSARERSSAVDFVFRNNNLYQGPASFSLTKTITISSMIPMRNGNRLVGVIAVSLPLNTELLAGIQTEFSLERLDDVDLLLIDGKDRGRLVAVTPAIVNSKNPFLKKLKDDGLKALPQPGGFFFSPDSGFENAGRWWKQFNLVGVTPSDILAVLLISTPIPNEPMKAASIVGIVGACGIVAFLLALLFTAGISKGVRAPLHFLIKRTKDIASQKTVLAPLEGLSGEFLELAELIDTAVSSMRQTIVSLKEQLHSDPERSESNGNQVEQAASQLASLNRQIETQSRQLTEISKQLNLANHQSALLKRKIDAIMHASKDGFLILDLFGNILGANSVFLGWAGATEGEIQGRLCFDLLRKPGQTKEEPSGGEAFKRYDKGSFDIVKEFYPEGVIYNRHHNQATEVIALLQPITEDDATVQEYVMVLHDKSKDGKIAQLKRDVAITSSEPVKNNLSAEPIFISRIVADCLEAAAPLARTRQLSLDYKTVTGLPAVKGNKDSVRSTLADLLERMIQTTQAGGRVRVESQIKGSELRLSITSSGPALPEEEVTDMFSGFIEGKHSEDTYGSRLSMYLARNNVERLGGRIWAESEAGRGTSIYFTLPII